MEKIPCVYIMASKENGVLYTGVTSHLVQRVWKHKNNFHSGFTQKYKVYKLVYFEIHDSMENAIIREKRIKTWQRQWKINLIESNNKSWNDLYDEIV